MTAFAYELATVVQAQAQARPGDPEGAYSMPWYLVLGSPGSGRSTMLKALNLRWPRGETPVPMNVPDPLCSYWIPEKAVFIEPGRRVLGAQRQQGLLYDLCNELKAKRPREPIDGIVLMVSAQVLADANEDGVEAYGKQLRRELVEVGQGLGADAPVYVVVSGYDTLWGFGDAFRWTADRRDEEPWGFTVPPEVGREALNARVKADIEGVTARIESMCFAKLSSEDAIDERARAFQHLSEARELMQKLTACLNVVTLSSAFEQAPWVRALAIGAAVPQSGNVLRHNAREHAQLGLYPPQHSGTTTPGGMPLHPLLEMVLLPERDLVPTRTRWRDDKLILILAMVGAVAWLGLVIIVVTRILSH
jgi:type VI protein secretion system component VasK